jgi:hypothetical protein
VKPPLAALLSCQGVLVDPGQVSAETRRTCVGIAVTGSLLVIAGVVLGLTAQVVPTGLPEAGVVAWGLIAGGMFCGIILIVASGPSPGSGGRRRPAPSGPSPAGPTGQPGISEEWIRALRPTDTES